MESTNDIWNELKELSPVVAAIGKQNVFRVPEGYFTRLSEDILAGVGHEGGAPLNITSMTNAEDVPQGYFENLADSILSRIKSETAMDELRTLSPMLYSIQNENVFEVPQGYFEGLGNEVLNKVKPQQAKVVTMRRRTATIFKYAVAAAFTGVMALGVFKFTGNKKTDLELPQYVIDGMKVKDVDQELSKLSDDAIMKYLEASGSDVKTALVANSVDANELPSEEEYLLDEQALDKYLNSINLGDAKN